MSFGFDPNAGLISVKVELWGPNGTDTFRFGLDTGATETVVRVDILAFLGYGIPLAPESARLIIASAIQFAHRVTV